jgi:hypothetical protein
MVKTKQGIVNIIAKEAGLTKKQASRKIRIPAKSKEAEAIKTKTSDKDWFQRARHLRTQIYNSLGGYAGDSVKELRKIREARVRGER